MKFEIHGLSFTKISRRSRVFWELSNSLNSWKYDFCKDFGNDNCCNINLWVPLCGVPYVFVGRPTSREHVSWLMSDIVLTVFNVALSI